MAQDSLTVASEWLMSHALYSEFTNTGASQGIAGVFYSEPSAASKSAPDEAGSTRLGAALRLRDMDHLRVHHEAFGGGALVHRPADGDAAKFLEAFHTF